MAEKKTVCVTGAGGYLASWLVKYLLNKGYIVHGTLRDCEHEKNSHLKKMENAEENLKIFKADLLEYEGLYAAIKGCFGVFHVASPLPPLDSLVVNPKEEILDPAINGTRNVLNACLEGKVKKVVVVSSVAAIAVNPHWPKDQVMDESCWSDMAFCESTKQWYFVSKTAAEKEAVEYAKKHSELNIVTVCPSVIIGPLLQPTMNTSSLYLLEFLRDGLDPADSGLRAFVDVRDNAEALVLVYEKPEAEGRYICSSHDIRTQDLVEKLKTMFSNYNYPKSFKSEDTWPRLTSKKLENLGWKYRTLEETLVDSVKNFEERGDLVIKT